MSMPLLSVCLITYNHSKYIRQAIESILMQKIKFDWEIIVADDCSSDGTTEIVKEYQKKFPEVIRTIIQPVNVGPSRNFFDLIVAANGKYIAYMEGDDFWIDENKLEKQVAILEANAEFVMVASNVNILKEDLGITATKKGWTGGVSFRFEDVLEENFISSVSVLFKREGLGDFMNYEKDFAHDRVIWLKLLTSGKGCYIQDATATYRIHNSGAHSGNSLFKNRMRTLKGLRGLLKFVPADKKSIVRSRIQKLKYKMFLIAIRSRNIKNLFRIIF